MYNWILDSLAHFDSNRKNLEIVSFIGTLHVTFIFKNKM